MIIDPATAPQDRADNGGLILYLSMAAGLTQFGAYVDRLMPGATSSQRHWHDSEDEFLYLLDGHLTLIDDDGATDLAPGDACAWRHGEPNAHCLENRSAQPATYLIAGTRVQGDICHYPDAGERQVNHATTWQILDAAGVAVDGGDLAPHLLNLPPRWGRAFDGLPRPRILRAGSVAGITGSGYPKPYDALSNYVAYPLSDAGGLTQFGAFTEVLMPGAQSSQRHWHEAEDEFLYVLDGSVTLVENDGSHILHPGQAVGWPRGVANGHCLRNETAQPVTYLVIGTRMADDTCHYPDIDLLYTRRNGQSCMSHKDGTPYPGWPKETL
jgi:uncharacterized cupin superfamily protein